MAAVDKTEHANRVTALQLRAVANRLFRHRPTPWSADVRSQLTATLQLLISANSMSEDLLGASGGLRSKAETSTEDCVSLLARLRAA